jgi:hypothetical protein
VLCPFSRSQRKGARCTLQHRSATWIVRSRRERDVKKAYRAIDGVVVGLVCRWRHKAGMNTLARNESSAKQSLKIIDSGHHDSFLLLIHHMSLTLARTVLRKRSVLQLSQKQSSIAFPQVCQRAKPSYVNFSGIHSHPHVVSSSAKRYTEFTTFPVCQFSSVSTMASEPAQLRYIDVGSRNPLHPQDVHSCTIDRNQPYRSHLSRRVSWNSET